MASIPKEVWQEHLLSAIDLIKGKRARPDVQRITEQVLKTLGSSSSSSFGTFGGLTEPQFKKRIIAELETAVAEEKIIKVRYKDGISYRNPEMMTTKGRERMSQETSTAAKDDQQEEQLGNGKGTAVATHGTQDDGNGTNGHRDVLDPNNVKMEDQDMKSNAAEDDVNSSGVVGTNNNHDETPIGTCTPPNNPSPPELIVFNTTPVPEEPMVSVSKPPILKLGPPTLKMGTSSSPQPPPPPPPLPSSSAVNHRSNASMDSNKSSSSTVTTDDSSSNRRGQRKRIKKSLGSDFLDPSELGYGFLKSAFDPKCSVCNEVGPRKDDLLNCSKCNFCAHPKCLQTGEKTLSLVAGEKKWLCPNCRPKCSTCSLNQAEVNNPLMTCVECDNCYHVNCLEFNLDADASNWKCLDCIDNDLEREAEKLGLEVQTDDGHNYYGHNGQGARMVVSNGHSSRKRTHSSSRSADAGVSLLMSSIAKSRITSGMIKESGNSASGCGLDGVSTADNQETPNCGASSADVVDMTLEAETEDKDKENKGSSVASTSVSGTYRTKVPSDWSVADVSDFLDFVGFSPEASLFRDQEIDGKSLLLLKRDDVINGLNLKLGPALKIYSLINHLQHR